MGYHLLLSHILQYHTHSALCNVHLLDRHFTRVCTRWRCSLQWWQRDSVRWCWIVGCVSLNKDGFWLRTGTVEGGWAHRLLRDVTWKRWRIGNVQWKGCSETGHTLDNLLIFVGEISVDSRTAMASDTCKNMNCWKGKKLMFSMSEKSKGIWGWVSKFVLVWTAAFIAEWYM